MNVRVKRQQEALVLHTQNITERNNKLPKLNRGLDKALEMFGIVSVPCAV